MPNVELLRRLETYLDAVPRSAAGVEPIGGLTLFTKVGPGWPYYARPALAGPAVTRTDLDAARRRQRALALPEAFEWVHETTPSMRPVAEAAGLLVESLPLMVLSRPMAVPVPVGAVVRMLTPDDPVLPLATAVADVAFSAGTTTTGPAGTTAIAGPAERDATAAIMPAERVSAARERMRRGRTFSAVAEEAGVGPLCVGSHQPVGEVSEIVGVGTLPTARRRGLAAAVTARLVADAAGRDVSVVFLSAGSEDVARLYARVGFVRVGTSCIAAPPGG